MTVSEPWQNQLASGVDDLRSHAAHFLNGRIVPDGDDFRATNGHSLRPGLLWVFGVNAAVDDDDASWFDDQALGTSEVGKNEEESEKS